MIVCIDGLVYKITNPLRLVYYVVSWMLGRLEALYFISYLDKDYFAYLTGLQLRGDYLTGDIGPIMLRNSTYKKLGPAFHACSKRAISCTSRALSSLSANGELQPTTADKRRRTITSDLSDGIFLWKNIILPQWQPEHFNSTMEMTSFDDGDALVSVLREANEHFELPSECTTEPTKQLFKFLRKSLRAGRRDKVLSRLFLRRKIPDVSLNMNGNVYDSEWYQSHFIFTDEERQLLTKLLEEIRKDNILLPESVFKNMYRDYRDKLVHSKETETKRLLKRASPLTDFSRFCILSRDRIFKMFPKTKKNFVLFWTVATRQWQSLLPIDNARRSFIACKPYQPYADTEELRRFLMYASEESDTESLTLVDMNLDLRAAQLRKETAASPSGEPLADITINVRNDVDHEKKMSQEEIKAVENAEDGKSDVDRADVDDEGHHDREGKDELEKKADGDRDGKRAHDDEAKEGSEGNGDDDNKGDYNPNFETSTGGNFGMPPPEGEQFEVTTTGMVHEHKDDVDNLPPQSPNPQRGVNVTLTTSISTEMPLSALPSETTLHDETLAPIAGSKPSLLDEDGNNIRTSTPILTEQIVDDQDIPTAGEGSWQTTCSTEQGMQSAGCIAGEEILRPAQPVENTLSKIPSTPSRMDPNGTFTDSDNTPNTSVRDDDAMDNSSSLKDTFFVPMPLDDNEISLTESVASLPTVRLRKVLSPVQYVTQPAVVVNPRELPPKEEEARSVPEKVSRYERIISRLLNKGSPWGRRATVSQYSGWASAGEEYDGDYGVSGNHQRSGHHPRKQRSLNVLESLNSESLQKLYQEQNETEFYSGKSLLNHVEDYKRAKKSEWYTNRSRSLRERLDDLLDDRMMDMANSAEFKHKMIQPKDLYERFVSLRARRWDTISPMEKEPYYEAFKRQYYWVIYHPDPEEQEDLMYDVAETCIEFGESSLPVVIRSVIDSREG
ncbi:DEKNAAC100375 [Brettanomyces naardenensis]|uniref:DEKNAAC100375 n=1 Tax=Brettanomyces naardenensis TaxID=13370 RepID=A0A448YFM2_BRENA|nr:DEKNAAC100375 [Brettanomyces naardenensis]